jgi:hypothetical protein
MPTLWWKKSLSAGQSTSFSSPEASLVRFHPPYLKWGRLRWANPFVFAICMALLGTPGSTSFSKRDHLWSGQEKEDRGERNQKHFSLPKSLSMPACFLHSLSSELLCQIMMCACCLLCFSSALTGIRLLIKDLVLTPVLLTSLIFQINIIG